MQDFFSTEFSFSLTGFALIGVGVFTLISFVAIVYYVNHLIHRIRTLEKPKYGFLGKSLYSVIALAVMVGGLGLFSYSFTIQQDFEIQATKTVTAQITADITKRGDTESIVEFEALPFVNNSQYGGNGQFDIFWNILGPESFDYFEFERAISSPSGFSQILDNGAYEIKVLIVFEGKSYNFTETLNI
ncbi:MAG: hypothetical protein ACE5DX_01510 [Candidatus Dojkabacteria bacterium]